MARRFNGVTGTVGAASVGDGATSTGAFHEALNQAAVEKLPLLLVVADNQFAYSTPTSRQFACRTLLDRASGYGVEGESVDGTDLDACLKVMGVAVEKARSGAGPQLIVARLLRLCGHGEHDDAHYVGAKLKSSPVGRDCLKVAEEEVQQRGWANAETIAAWRSEAAHKIDEAVATGRREPAPDPFKENWCAISAKHLSEGYDEIR
jgi:pyruvate dehydrogenase E1 component alpha subunit/2-oxoisovalerate dehydrogenase E1 component alpha subunit